MNGENGEDELAVQDQYAPNTCCFGCGPSNTHGLKIKSFRREEGLEMSFRPEEHHQAFPGVVGGGIIGILIDCHGNWTAAVAIMDNKGLEEPLTTVTADFWVKLRRPTPFGLELSVTSKVVELKGEVAKVEVSVEAGGKVTATGGGTFVAVREGHPAWHKWN